MDSGQVENFSLVVDRATQDRKGRTVSEEVKEDFPGGPVVETLRFHCRGHGFNPWSRN